MLLLVAAPVHAQEARRPSAANRIVAQFGFEERLIHDEPVPRHWHGAQHYPPLRERPGFHVWNEAHLDYTTAYSGEGSVRLNVRGGSASLRLEAGAIPIFPETDYRIGFVVRTHGLAHARAGLRARLLDAAGVPIPGGERSSEPIISEDQWTGATVDLVSLSPRAAFLQLDLELLQPAHARPVLQGEIPAEDLDGAAWFDDVVVMQLPRVTLRTQSEINIIRAPARPELTLHVRDLAVESLRARVRVADLRGEIVSDWEGSLASGAPAIEWTPALPAFGWHRAVLDLEIEGVWMRGADVDFLWLGGSIAASPGPDPAFGILLPQWDPRIAPRLPAMASDLGIGSITLPAWRHDLTLAEMGPWVVGLGDTISPLVRSGVSVGMALDRLPDEFGASAALEPDQVIAAMTDGTGAIRPYLDPILERFGQGVREWMIGRPEDDEVFWLGSDDADRVRESLTALVPEPILMSPWRLSESAAAMIDSGHGLSVSVPPGACESAIEDFMWSVAAQGAAPQVTAVLEPLEVARFGGPGAVGDSIRRAVRLWRHADAGAALRITVSSPWRLTDARHPEICPTIDLAVLAALRTHLSGRRIVGGFDLEPGVRCVILGSASGSEDPGAIIAWCDEVRSATLDALLSAGKVRVEDVFGNSSDVDAAPSPETGLMSHRVSFGEDPVFIEGVNVPLALFQCGAVLDPSALTASNETTDHTLIFSNPWDIPITGRFSLVSPGGDPNDRSWRVSPRSGALAIPSRQSIEIPVAVSMSPFQEAGSTPFEFNVDLIADRSYGIVRVRAPASVGVDGLEMEVLASRGPGSSGPDAGVRVVLTNRGDSPATLELSAFAPGMERQRSIVSELAPGERTTRVFAYANGARAIGSSRIVVSAMDVDRGVRLTRSARLPEMGELVEAAERPDPAAGR